jgi:hypothetical protein
MTWFIGKEYRRRRNEIRKKQYKISRKLGLPSSLAYRIRDWRERIFTQFISNYKEGKLTLTIYCLTQIKKCR